jgi:LPXTG-motif cell wall-anchored protein
MRRFLTPLALSTAALMALFVAIVSFANLRVERDIEQAVKHNFAAAGLLSKLQIQAERMRRYEKELFIYAAVPEKRAKYVKEFDEAHAKLLDLQNQAMASQHKGFSEADRAEVLKWASASSFYANEFRKVVATAEFAGTAEQKAELTVKLNNDIGPGKDRFRTVLDGAAALREAKEKASLDIHTDIQQGFDRLNWIVMAMGLLIVAIGFVVFARKKEKPGSASGSAFQRSSQFTTRRS